MSIESPKEEGGDQSVDPYDDSSIDQDEVKIKIAQSTENHDDSVEYEDSDLNRTVDDYNDDNNTSLEVQFLANLEILRRLFFKSKTEVLTDFQGLDNIFNEVCYPDS